MLLLGESMRAKRRLFTHLFVALAFFSMMMALSQATIAQAGTGTQSIQSSDENWGGYVVVSNYLSPQPVFNAVMGSWIVPSIPSNVFYGTTNRVSEWVGIGGSTLAADGNLIQVGTEEISYPIGGNSYFAWYEMVPGNASAVQVFSVSPGDVINAFIQEVGTGNSYTISIIDSTNNNYFQHTFTYSPDKTSAEWIVEKNLSEPLSDFNVIDFGPAYTSGNYNNVQDQANGSDLNIGQLPNYEVTIKNSGGTTLAYPNALGSDQSSFTMTWQNPS